MKNAKLLWFVCWLMFAFPPGSRAQTASNDVAQGQLYLMSSNLVSANLSFSNSVAVSPTNFAGNFYYAATRLLVLPEQPGGSNFLTRLGFPLIGRNLYEWDAALPKDVNGQLVAPAGVNADEFTAQLRTNALPAVAGGITNLSKITGTNFSLYLPTSQTTRSTSVTADYGDVKLLLAEAYATEYFIYILNSQNCDALLTSVQALHTNDDLTPLNLLTDYPQLLTYASTNDLPAAKAAFTNGVNAYMTASAFIRARPPNQVNLFNLDEDSTNDEANFRSVLQNLETSLSGPVVLALRTNVTVDMAAQFTGTTTVRSLLPVFGGDGREILSEGVSNPKVVPDITFGGIIYGLTQTEASDFLSKYFVILDTNTPVVITTNLPGGTNGVAYSQTLAATGGQLPYNWTIVSGGLPQGLSLATNGVIFGTPTVAGTNNFTAEVTDALSETATQTLSLAVAAASVVTTNPPVVTANGMALIPGGTFTMGDVNDTNWSGDAAPVSVTVANFYMDTNLVSLGQWQAVYAWATNPTNGYSFAEAGSDKAAGHPVQTVDWYDVVKWNNARSQQAGLAPAYYTDAALTQVYKSGEPANIYVKWTNNAYRLPTEAEWEKAARGGVGGQRFPWGNTIGESNANYYGDSEYAFYDLSTNGFNPNFSSGNYPYTSPAGYFPANGYGLTDMAGNVWEWCWDWYGTNYAGGGNPHGPASGSFRVLRGGGWDGYAYACRSANRDYGYADEADNDIGFRSVISSITTGAAPVITAGPQSKSVLAGGMVSFSVTATGTAPLAYQWYDNNNPLSGATNATYDIASVQTSNAGSYVVVVTNGYGSASAAATLSVSTATNFSIPTGWLTQDKDIYGSRNGGYATRSVNVSTYTNVWTLAGGSTPLTGDVLGNSNSQLVVNIPGGIGIFNGGGTELGFIATGAHLACLADANQDGTLEILAVQMDTNFNFQVLVYAGNGALLKTIQVAGTGQSDQTVTPMFAADLNGDGRVEIVSQLTSGYGVSSGGVRGWEVTSYATGLRVWRDVVGPVANGIRWLGTTNGNLLAGAWGPENNNTGADQTSDSANYTWSYPPATGVASWIRNYTSGGFYDSGIFLPDLNGDGTREIVTTTTLHGTSLGDYGYGAIHLLNPANGGDEIVTNLGHYLDFRNAAFGVLGGGPGDDLVVATYEGSTPYLHAFGSSNLVAEASYSRASGTFATMAVADLAGSGVQQVLAAYQPSSGDAHLIILSGDMTQLLWEGDLGLATIQSVAVDGLNQDGSLAVAVSGTSAGGTNQVVVIEPSLAYPPVPFTFTTNNNQITITGYTGTNPVVAIPGTINGYLVTGIRDGAFYTNAVMTSVTIPNSVTSIGASAFQYCNLTNVTLSTGVTTIGEAAFYSCRSLTSVLIPGSVTSIGIEAFGQCSSMTSIIVDSQNLFYSSTNGVLFNKSQNVLIEYPAGVSGSYTIPSGVTGIGGAAFFSGSLSNVTISSGVTNIGDLAFVGGPLTTITVVAQNPFYSSLNGVLFNKNQTTLVEFPGGRGGSYMIPNSVTTIGDNAFYANYGLTSAIIPASVISIGSDAFWNCIGLTNVTIGNSVTSIGDEAFAYCYNSLTTVYFQGNAPAADSAVFSGDTNATAYFLPGTTGWSAFTAATGVPAVPWFQPTPVVLNNEAGFGIQSNRFGFTASWDTNASVVIQAATNLISPVWVPVGTNSLTNGSFFFSDPKWTNYPIRFYRLSAP